MKNFKQLFACVRCFVFDVDGVLTNGSLLVAADGEFLRTMNIKDGYAIQHAVKKGYLLAVISGGRSSGIPVRMNRLGVDQVFMGVENKLSVLQSILKQKNIPASETLYIGDDIPDIEAMRYCGIIACPHDAVAEVKAIAHYVSPFNGGEGCVRDVIEQVLKIRGDW